MEPLDILNLIIKAMKAYPQDDRFGHWVRGLMEEIEPQMAKLPIEETPSLVNHVTKAVHM